MTQENFEIQLDFETWKNLSGWKRWKEVKRERLRRILKYVLEFGRERVGGRERKFVTTSWIFSELTMRLEKFEIHPDLEIRKYSREGVRL